MEHVVFFPSFDGAPAFRRLPSFEEAVRLVEHLRNVEGVEQVSVHALTEVPLAFRAYYRVEVPAAWDPSAEAAAGQPVPAPAEQAPVADEPVTLVPVPSEPQVVAVEPQPESAPALALVEALPVQPQPEQEQHRAEQAQLEQAQAEQVQPEPSLAASNGHGRDGAASLGFFA